MKRLPGSAVLSISLALPGVARADDQGNGRPGMEAGGLTPPPPEGGENAESAQTEEKLEKADKEDSGRGLEFIYLNAEGGFENLGLQTFHSNNLVDSKVVPTSATGPLFGAGAGIRLLFLTAGVRFRLAHFSQYDLWNIGAELGLRIPLGNFEPYFVLGGGYAALGSFNGGNIGPSASDVSIRGVDIRGGGGIDYYVTPVFSVGANLTAELLLLTRPGVSLQNAQNTATGSPGTGVPQASAQIYAADGSSAGLGIAGTIVLGLHF